MHFISFTLLHCDRTMPHARGRSQRGERRCDDACQHLEDQPPSLFVFHHLPPFFSNVPLIVFLVPLIVFFSPAEIKEIKEIF